MRRNKLVPLAVASVAIAVVWAVRLGVLKLNLLALKPDTGLLAYRPLLLAAAAGWVLFGLYWKIAARNASEARSSESRASRAVHLFLTNAALALEIAPIHGLGRVMPASLWIIVTGLAIESAGLVLAVWARRHLGQNWSGEITIKVEHELIQSGPYRWVRHPIYTGVLAMYAGILLVTGEWLAVVGFIVAGLAYWRKVRLEEANLKVAFGTNYEAYSCKTWALVPGIF